MSRDGNDIDVVLVSDLHLGAWPAVQTRRYVDAFAGLVDHLQHLVAARGERCRLVLLGDTVDFLHLRVEGTRRSPVPERTEDAGLRKIDHLVDVHPRFFAALGDLIVQGWHIDVVSGNHDVELAHDSVCDRFRDAVGSACGAEEAVEELVQFHPWLCHLPGLLYAEHGHQHHDINSLTTIAQPFEELRDPRLRLPLASYLPAGTTSPWGLLRSGAGLVREAARLASPATRRLRQRYREEVLPRMVSTLQLDHATLVELDSLSESSAPAIAARLARKWLRRTPPGSLTQRGDYLHQGARRVHRVLAGAGAAVPFYVFGHTHVAEHFPLLDAATGHSYLNCGTWSPAVPGREAADGPLLSFVHVRCGGERPQPSASLRCWDEDTATSVAYHP